MSRRAINWSVVLFALSWFGVLVPVHNRGQIAPLGTEHCANDHACCASKAKHGEGPGKESRPQPARACAVCFFIAALHTPPPPTLVNNHFTLAGSFRVAPHAEPDAAGPALTTHSRAPPTA